MVSCRHVWSGQDILEYIRTADVSRAPIHLSDKDAQGNTPPTPRGKAYHRHLSLLTKKQTPHNRS